jgi:hypothetical protein
MKNVLFLLTMALGLASSFGAPIQISALPFNITAPGTYVLTSNKSSVDPAITINTSVAGPVVLDLGGFTILSNNGGTSSGGVSVPANPTGSSITIRNGTIQGFYDGIQVQTGSATGYVSNIHIEKINLSNSRWAGVEFFQVNSSSIIDCSVTAPGGSGSAVSQWGIRDLSSEGGNRYVNISFDGNQFITLEVQENGTNGTNGPSVLEHFHFEAP